MAGIGEGREPVHLVLLQDAQLHDGDHADEGDGAQDGDVAGAGPGHHEDAEEDGAEDEVGPEVGLQVDQPHGNGRQPHDRQQAPAVEVAIFRAEAALCVADVADGAGASASVLPPRGALIRA